MNRVVLQCLVVILVSCHVAPSESQADRAPHLAQTTLAIQNVTLVDGRTGSQESGVTILVAGERIVAVGPSSEALTPDVRVLDGTGKWVVPGLIDVHVHDSSEAYLRDMLAWGVTAIHLMPSPTPGDPGEIELGSEAPHVPTPRLQVTEMFAGEFPDNLFPGAYQFTKPQASDEARQVVRESHGRGFRQIKIILDDSFQWSGEAHRVPMIPEPVFDALVAQAHALDMRVYVHATQSEVSRQALAAGLDAFMHGVMDRELSADDLQRMASAGTAWAPTVNALWCFGDQRAYARRVVAEELFVALLDDEERAQWKAMAEAENSIILPPTAFLVEHTGEYVAMVGENTRRVHGAGVSVAVGTDGGPGGISTHLELEFLQATGLTAAEVLSAATYGGAVALGREDDLGTVEVGKLADMVILNADPSADIRNCREIEWVIKGGQIHLPRELALGQ